jgi:7-cyano-7-deazaguanine tRNA-ribosyltransferase
MDSAPIDDRRAATTGAGIQHVGSLTLPNPAYMPVHSPRRSLISIDRWRGELGLDALILNAFLLYKNRETREVLEGSGRIHDFIGFHGCVMTDSGAFQGMRRPLYLENSKIVAFQARIGSNIVSPLDLITPPSDNRSVAERKLEATNKRIREAIRVAPASTVAGVQQGGRFLDLRRRSTEALLAMGVRYIALGSLVPFFNSRHSLRFIGEVILETRAMTGPELPMHVYGAGDPVELPFLTALGATVFDSSAYGHYAQGAWYMTPYGALRAPGPLLAGEYACECASCRQIGYEAIFGNAEALAFHNLWTVLDVMRSIRKHREMGTLEHRLEAVLEQHKAWFPDSELNTSWEQLRG